MLWPGRTAVIDTDHGIRYSYDDLRDRALATAGWLYQHGVREGDRVAVLSLNGVPLLDLFFACARLGAILVPWNWRLSRRELGDMFADTEPGMILVTTEFEELSRSLPRHTQSICLDGPEGIASEILSCTTGHPERCARMTDPWLILYTGGTTGTPKGAVLTRGSVTGNSVNTVVSWGLGYQDVGPVFTPAFHTGFWNVFTLPLLLVGGCVLIPQRFDAGDALEVLVRERPSICFMVPTMFQLVAEEPGFDDADLSSLRWAISGGAPLPAPVFERWRSKVRIFKQGYGLTEVGPNNFATPDDPNLNKPGTVGRLTYFASARIVDDDGHNVAVGESGELLLAGPHMCAGYWGRPEATKEAIRDGWFHTGDVARKDMDGYYYIVDRKKDLVITGGENVFPSEVETVLYSHPAIRECAVVGTPDPVWGEAVTAIVALNQGYSITVDELRSYTRENLARYKCPKEIIFADTLPKTGANKISRAGARELAIAQLQPKDERSEPIAEGQPDREN